MTYAAVAVGGLSFVGGLSSSKSSKKQAKRQLDLMEKQFAFDKQRYDDYQKQYGGTIQKLVDQADAGVQADLGGVTSRAAGDVATTFKGANESMLRDQQRLGINPNSGRAEAMNRQNAIDQATATAGLVTQQREGERRRAEDQTTQQRQYVAQMGLNQLNRAADAMSNTNNAMSNALGAQSQQAANDAGAMFGLAGNIAGQYIQGLPSKSTTTPTTGAVAGISSPQYLSPTVNPVQKVGQQIDNFTKGNLIEQQDFRGATPVNTMTQPFYALPRR